MAADKKLLKEIDRYLTAYYIPEYDCQDEMPIICEDEDIDIIESIDFDESSFTKQKIIQPLSKSIALERNLDMALEQLDETFSQKLLRMIKERNMNESDVYKRAFVDRRHFSKIKKDAYYTPNKKTVLAFAIAMELSTDETKDLLRSAGYALSRSSKFDVIIAYFLEEKIYDMFEVNEVLYEYEQPFFG